MAGQHKFGLEYFLTTNVSLRQSKEGPADPETQMVISTGIDHDNKWIHVL